MHCYIRVGRNRLFVLCVLPKPKFASTAPNGCPWYRRVQMSVTPAEMLREADLKPQPKLSDNSCCLVRHFYPWH